MKRGDIFAVSLEPTEGRQQRGTRPVVIVSPDAFNAATKFPIICPITTGGEFAKKIGFAVSLVGTHTTGIIRCDQPRVLDLTSRHAQKIETLPPDLMDEVLAKLAPIFE